MSPKPADHELTVWPGGQDRDQIELRCGVPGCNGHLVEAGYRPAALLRVEQQHNGHAT